MNADTAIPTNADAAIPAYLHIAPASRVGTTGSGGKPVHLRLVEQQEERAVAAHAVVRVVAVQPRLGYTPRSATPRHEAAARSRNSSSTPNWIESVGHAFAHAGSNPSCSRS